MKLGKRQRHMLRFFAGVVGLNRWYTVHKSGCSVAFSLREKGLIDIDNEGCGMLCAITEQGLIVAKEQGLI